MSHRPAVPHLVIVVPVEGRPSVYRAGNHAEADRLWEWILSQPGLGALLDQAYQVAEPSEPSEPAPEPEDVEPDEDEWDEDEWVALIFKDYASYPRLSLRDLEPAPGGWLAAHGVDTEEGRVLRWSVPYDPDAEPGDAAYRPGALFPPSVRELDERGPIE